MGIWSFLTQGTAGRQLAQPPAVLTPYTPQDTMQTVLVNELYGARADAALPALNAEAAMRVPAFKRAHDITCGVLARMPWRQYAGDQLVAEQPGWLTAGSGGVSPYHMRWGVYSDLFTSAQAVIGFELDENGQPAEALHIPRAWWTVDADGIRVTDKRVPARYQQRLVWINLGYGTNGMLVDGFDTINDARDIEAAYRDRIKNPIAQTDLELAGERWDMWNKEEREEFRQLWIEGRKAGNGATALRPDWVKPNYSAQLPVDLFESGRNANRLDMANHAGLPASLLEGSKQSGGGDMHYSTEAGGQTRNELYDFGLAKYADAAGARLSLDDVCPSGESIRVDASNYLTSTPIEPQTSED